MTAATEGGPHPSDENGPAPVDEAADDLRTTAAPRERYRLRQPARRTNVRSVRLSDQELAAVRRAAAACGMTTAGYLAHAAVTTARHPEQAAAAIADRQQLLAELFAARRYLMHISNNVNQIAKTLNSGGPAPHAEAVLAATRLAADRIEAAALHVAHQG